MASKIKESWRKQKGFIVITILYCLTQFLLWLEFTEGITPMNLLEGVLIALLLSLLQVYTNYMIMLVSCSILPAIPRVVIDVLGMLFNVVYTPFCYVLVTILSIEGAHNYGLFNVLIIVYASFILVYLIKLVVDIIEIMKQKSLKKEMSGLRNYVGDGESYNV